MSSIEKLLANLKTNKEFKVYVEENIDTYNKGRHVMTFTETKDGLWDIDVGPNYYSVGCKDFSYGKRHDVPADLVYDMVADLFYKWDAVVVFKGYPIVTFKGAPKIAYDWGVNEE